MNGQAMAKKFPSERHRQQRFKNYAVMGVIVALVVIFYVVFIVRSGGL